MSNLPSGWTSAPISEVCELNPRRDRAFEISTQTSVTFVPMPSVNANTGTIDCPLERPLGELLKGYTTFRENDVLMAKITPCMENGKAAIASGLRHGIGFGSTEFHVFRSNGAALPQYLFHFIRQKSFRRDAEKSMTGAVGQRRVPASYFESKEIPLPPFAEQARIVDKLEVILGEVDNARERLEPIPGLLKKFRQSLLDWAVTGKLTKQWRSTRSLAPVALSEVKDNAVPQPLPSSWVRTALLNTIHIKHGFAFKSSDFVKTGNLVVTTPGHFYESGGFRDQGPKTKYLRSHSLIPEGFTLDPGDLIVAMTEQAPGLLGSAAFIPNDGKTYLHNQRLGKISPMSNDILKEYLFLVFNHQLLRKELAESCTGTTVRHTSPVKIYSVPILVPPCEEQSEIVRQVKILFELANEVERYYNEAASDVENLAQSILKLAFEGRLVPQNLNDEPAEKLLERTRSAQRSSLQQTAPARTSKRKTPTSGIASKKLSGVCDAHANSRKS